MKKVALCLLIAFGLVASSNASISVNFTTLTGAVANPGGTTAGDLFTGSGTIQLIWSTINAYSSASEGGGVDSGYYILWSGTLTGGFTSDDLDGIVDYTNANVGGNNVNAGYIYGRVFDSTTITLSSYYANSGIFSTAGFADASGSPKPTPNLVDLIDSPTSVYDGDFGAYMLPMNLNVVPEPSVLAFLGLGGLALAARRRFVA